MFRLLTQNFDFEVTKEVTFWYKNRNRKIGIPFYCSSCGFRREQGDSVRDRNN